MLQNSTTDFQIKEPLNGKLWEKEWHCLVAVERTLVQKGVNEDAGGRYGVGAPSRGWLSNNQHVSMHQGTMYSLQQRVRRRPSSGPAGSPSRDRSPERVTRLSSGTGGQEGGGTGGGDGSGAAAARLGLPLLRRCRPPPYYYYYVLNSVPLACLRLFFV